MNKYQKQLEKARDEAYSAAYSNELNWQIDKTLKLLKL
jgi:hypothetical protein